ncbi:MAG TPA: hypothetical protein VNZ48_16340 [Xanthobacteraceae bacterium]|nr:hypothetical protein [Xanthobacteraceae bacterium]
MALSRPGDRGWTGIPQTLASNPRQVTRRKRKCAAYYEQNGPANVVLTLGEAAVKSSAMS